MNNKVLPNSRTAQPLLLAIVTLLAGVTHSKQSSAATVADTWQGYFNLAISATCFSPGQSGTSITPVEVRLTLEYREFVLCQ